MPNHNIEVEDVDTARWRQCPKGSAAMAAQRRPASNRSVTPREYIERFSLRGDEDAGTLGTAGKRFYWDGETKGQAQLVRQAARARELLQNYMRQDNMALQYTLRPVECVLSMRDWKVRFAGSVDGIGTAGADNILLFVSARPKIAPALLARSAMSAFLYSQMFGDEAVALVATVWLPRKLTDDIVAIERRYDSLVSEGAKLARAIAIDSKTQPATPGILCAHCPSLGCVLKLP